MDQQLDLECWPSICFECEMLPQRVIGISILIHRDFTECSSDWIWRPLHCSEVCQKSEAEWCIGSVSEIIDHLLEYRAEVAAEVHERLASYGIDSQTTLDEWLCVAMFIFLQKSISEADVIRASVV